LTTEIDFYLVSSGYILLGVIDYNIIRNAVSE